MTNPNGSVKCCTTRGRGLTRTIEAIQQARDFKTGGGLRGDMHDYIVSTGMLTGPALNMLYADRDAAVALAESMGEVWEPRLYVIRSYSTPIAWRTNATPWRMVGRKFSTTTSRHQSIVRGALAARGWEITDV